MVGLTEIMLKKARLHGQGNRLAVRFGLAGPTSLAGLIKYARMCGVSASTRFLRQHGQKIAHLATEHAPDALIREFATAADVLSPKRIAGVHFFPFGGFVKTAAWAEALRLG